MAPTPFFEEHENPPPSGRVDRFIRRFHGVSYALAVLAIYVLGAVALGLALVPSLAIVARLAPPLWGSGTQWRWPALAALLAGAVFLWGFALLVVVPALNFVLPTRLRPFRGGYFTVAAVPWYLHNGLFYLVRYTFLPFVSLTPMGTWFLRAMGMRIGRRVRITTEFFTDVSMMTVGDDSVIGGSATLFCHYGGGGHLVIAPVVIGRRVTIGERATIMGDVVIGDDARILAHAALLPGTRVGAGEVWGGAPARRIPEDEWARYKLETRGGTQ